MKKNITLQEVFENPEFTTQLLKGLQSIEDERASVLRKMPGARFKVSAYSKLKNRGALNLQFLSQELLLIIAKKSKLPSSERTWIEDFMRTIVARTLNALRADEASKKKKTRVKKNEKTVQ